MLVRVIYRPSHHRVTSSLDLGHGAVHALSSEPHGLDPNSVEAISDGHSSIAAPNVKLTATAKPHKRSHRVLLRSMALFLFRSGLAAVVMAAWRIASDLGLPLHFVFTAGLFSHWQVWFGAAVLLIGSAGVVVRRLEFGKARDDQNTGRTQVA